MMITSSIAPFMGRLSVELRETAADSELLFKKYSQALWYYRQGLEGLKNRN